MLFLLRNRWNSLINNETIKTDKVLILKLENGLYDSFSVRTY